MAIQAAVGQSLVLDGREAGFQAAQQAAEKLGRLPLIFAWVVAPSLQPLNQVLAGVADLIGDVPVLGFSSSGSLSSEGMSRRAVTVALLAGMEVQGRSGWWSDYSQNSLGVVQSMLRGLQPNEDDGDILMVASDGLDGDATLLCETLSEKGYAFVGALAGGDLLHGRTYQAGGRQSGHGGLAAGVLSGNIVAGVGAGHGWQPVGATVRLTRVQGAWVRTLDGQPANETYARLFGQAPREWLEPPLSNLARLYPLGLEEDGELVLRSPVHFEADGSLRMNSRLPEGQLANILVGTQAACLKAAREAAEQALANLGPTRPRLAMLLVDAAWQPLFESQPGAEVTAVRQVLGSGVPIFGGYTLGQMARLGYKAPAQFFNQHIIVALFGLKKVEEVSRIVA